MNPTIRNVPACEVKAGDTIKHGETWRTVHRVRALLEYVELMHGPEGHPGDLKYETTYKDRVFEVRQEVPRSVHRCLPARWRLYLLYGDASELTPDDYFSCNFWLSSNGLNLADCTGFEASEIPNTLVFHFQTTTA